MTGLAEAVELAEALSGVTASSFLHDVAKVANKVDNANSA
jgi:hypothetical protein